MAAVSADPVLELQIASTWDGQPAAADEVASIRLSRTAGGLRLDVDAPWHGDPSPPHAPGSCDGLWNFEVVELFLVSAAQRYLEIELGPYGHYLALRFDGIRHRVGLPLDLADLQCHRRSGRWSAVTDLPWTWLAAPIESVNAFAIHGQGPHRRYLAHAATGGESRNFHRLGAYPQLDAALRSLFAPPLAG